MDDDSKGPNIISDEEYHPYGTTSYQATNSAVKAVAKRYRFTTKERDEESGLYYHGARYYIPWLARWCAVDPLESKYAGWSSYNYCVCNPAMHTDPTGTQLKKDEPEGGKREDNPERDKAALGSQNVRPVNGFTPNAPHVGLIYNVQILDSNGNPTNDRPGDTIGYPHSYYIPNDPYSSHESLTVGSTLIRNASPGHATVITNLTYRYKNYVNSEGVATTELNLVDMNQQTMLPPKLQFGVQTTVQPVLGELPPIPLNISFQANTSTQRGNVFRDPAAARASLQTLSTRVLANGNNSIVLNVNTNFSVTTIPNFYPTAQGLLQARANTVTAQLNSFGVNVARVNFGYDRPGPSMSALQPNRGVIGWNVTRQNIQNKLDPTGQVRIGSASAVPGSVPTITFVPLAQGAPVGGVRWQPSTPRLFNNKIWETIMKIPSNRTNFSIVR